MKIFSLQYACQILTFFGIYYYWNEFTWAWGLVIALGITFFALTLLECFMQRYCCHNAFKLNHYVETFILYTSTLCTFGPATTHAAYHKKHHRHSDKEGDSHPASDGWRNYLWLNINDYHTTSRDILSVRKLLKKKHFNIQSEHYFKIWFALFIPLAVISPMFTLCFVLIPIYYQWHISGIVNTVCHKWGYRNFNTNDNSVNINIPLIANGLHNNHHQNPSAITTRVNWYEIDLGEYIIKMIRI